MFSSFSLFFADRRRVPNVERGHLRRGPEEGRAAAQLDGQASVTFYGPYDS